MHSIYILRYIFYIYYICREITHSKLELLKKGVLTNAELDGHYKIIFIKSL